MTRKDQVIDDLAEIIGSYTSGCVICGGSTTESKIYIYYLHWDCYKKIRLLVELEKL